MARTEYYYFQGKTKWCKAQNPDLEYKNWNVPLWLTPDSLLLFNKLKEPEGDTEGILNETKLDDDGEHVTFKRPMFKNFGKGDEPLQPPEIINADGQPMSKDQLIGNGSDVTVKVERYTYRKPFGKGRGSAIRLVAVKVDTLVPYTRESLTPESVKNIKGLEKQPAQLAW